MPAVLRQLDRNSKKRWLELGAEFGLLDEDDLMMRHEKFVQRYSDTRSDDWPGLVRSWIQHGAKLASAATFTSKTSPSAHIPLELTDVSHPNYDGFRAQLEPLARKYGLTTAGAIDAQRVFFKDFWSQYGRRELELLEAWEVFLAEQKRKGLLGVPQRRSAI